ncbi:EF-hand domain-containing protein [Limimaricola pyoseonensis]|uniref:Ca2+-binding protein, EF-hand superfamily n=1 Tax=Limimaricola pyoseonensis TaxID=521013 RepID=A0A1G7G006_9RHOB|nr:hypothetical protein [Limimaricola pyoseonensis]SDE81476.1 Ca2+-binding protein, EF-hand superfamily [Limimaricola pyoseonensis]
MKPKTFIPAAFLATALTGAVAAIATAQGATLPADAAATGTAPAELRQAHAEEHGRMGRHHGPRGGRGHHGGGEMMRNLFEQADADGDGSLSRAEIDAFRAAQVSGADASGDGALSIEEFETLWSAFTRSRMVDAFQELDADGDGAITAAEIDGRVDRMVERLDRDGDGTIGPDDRPRRR